MNATAVSRHDNQEQDPGLRAGHSHLMAQERIVVNQHGNQGGCAVWPALCHQERGIELLECLAELCNQVIENNRCDKGYCNLKKLGPLACAVNGGSLIQIF